jgi:hypothetical protein
MHDRDMECEILRGSGKLEKNKIEMERLDTYILGVREIKLLGAD